MIAQLRVRASFVLVEMHVVATLRARCVYGAWRPLVVGLCFSVPRAELTPVLLSVLASTCTAAPVSLASIISYVPAMICVWPICPGFDEHEQPAIKP